MKHKCPVCSQTMFGDDDSPTDICPTHGKFPNPDFNEEVSRRKREETLEMMLNMGIFASPFDGPLGQ